MSNQEEVELRAKIEALGLEITKVPSKSTQNLDEVYILFFLIFLKTVNKLSPLFLKTLKLIS